MIYYMSIGVLYSAIMYYLSREAISIQEEHLREENSDIPQDAHDRIFKRADTAATLLHIAVSIFIWPILMLIDIALYLFRGNTPPPAL